MGTDGRTDGKLNSRSRIVIIKIIKNLLECNQPTIPVIIITVMIGIIKIYIHHCHLVQNFKTCQCTTVYPGYTQEGKQCLLNTGVARANLK